MLNPLAFATPTLLRTLCPTLHHHFLHVAYNDPSWPHTCSASTSSPSPGSLYAAMPTALRRLLLHPPIPARWARKRQTGEREHAAKVGAGGRLTPPSSPYRPEIKARTSRLYARVAAQTSQKGASTTSKTTAALTMRRRRRQRGALGRRQRRGSREVTRRAGRRWRSSTLVRTSPSKSL